MASSTTKFSIDYAKRVSGCKKCKQQITKGELRMARLVPNPFTKDSDKATEMKQYFHPECLFETLTRCRASTKVIESPADIEDYGEITSDDKKKVLDLIADLEKARSNKGGGDSRSPKKNVDEKKQQPASNKKKERKGSPHRKERENLPSTSNEKKKEQDGAKKSSKQESPAKEVVKRSEKKSEVIVKTEKKMSKFDSFKTFCKLCEVISSVSKYTDKSEAVNLFVTRDGYDGDLLLLVRMLIPGSDLRVYNLKEKQLIKLFSNIFSWNAEELTEDFNLSGDVSVTIRKFFEKSCESDRKSQLSNQDVDKWLDKLTELTKEEDQQQHLSRIANRTTPLELQYVLRLIKKDLRFNAGAKHILEGIKIGAYEAYQNSRDLKAVIEKCQLMGSDEKLLTDSGISLGVPVKPMLAEPCRSVEQAMKTCVNGMYSEIKYDGERLQLHKNGENFTFFSRSLKPVQEHKVSHLSDVIPQAFPSVNDMILDAEVLMVDTSTGKPLPFGTLGIHKKEKFANAVVCLFIFDCLLFDGKSLIDWPLKKRKKLLEENIKEVPNRVLLSNYQLIKHGEHDKLKTMIWKAIDEGLEGLVLKDLESVYEPGKRHWLKVKKDYLEEGRMADTADLIVLGAYYGTGSKGGMMSVFLMGVHDAVGNKFLTVTKCGNGHDDATLDRINKQLSSKMRKISRNYDNLPHWLKCSRSLVPDFVIDDPKSAPVWEITGAEFSRSDNHTANGISIRFPRVTRIRDDKSWDTATNLEELQKLFDTSKDKTDLDRSLEDSIPLFAKNEVNNPFGDSAALDEDIEKLAKEKARKRKASDEEGKEDEDEKGPSTSGAGESSGKKNPAKRRRESGDDKGKEEKSRKRNASGEDTDEDAGEKGPSTSARGDTDRKTNPKKERKQSVDDEGKDKASESNKTKSPCKYGAQCYRKNPDHFAKYSHPSK